MAEVMVLSLTDLEIRHTKRASINRKQNGSILTPPSVLSEASQGHSAEHILLADESSLLVFVFMATLYSERRLCSHSKID